MKQYYYIVMSQDRKRWLPAKKNRNATSVALSAKAPPRLFNTMSAAIQAIRWWRDGISYSVTTGDGYNEPYDVDIVTRKVEHRKHEQLVVEEVILRSNTHEA